MSMMTHTWLIQQVRDDVATVTINHPPVNVLTPQGLLELDLTLDDLAENDQVKVVIITGTGRAFIAGADIRLMAQIGTPQKAKEMALKGQEVFKKIETFNKPIIAAINGVCLGGGLELALCCHIRVAAEGIHLGLPEINLGIIPGFGGTQRLPRVIGQSKATEFILIGTPITGQEGKTLGLISQVYPQDELMSQATGLALQIASKGQMAVRSALKALRAAMELEHDEGFREEATLFGELFQTEDQHEGMTAFLEKRPPNFKNR